MPLELDHIKSKVNSHMPEQVMRDFQNVSRCSDVDLLTVLTHRIFDHIDEDKNGQIEGDEIINFYQEMNSQTLENFSSLVSHMSESEKKAVID